MDQDARIRQYELSAVREENAAARATSLQSAHLHQVLATMHRHEVAKMEAVRGTLRLAFGD